MIPKDGFHVATLGRYGQDRNTDKWPDMTLERSGIQTDDLPAEKGLKHDYLENQQRNQVIMTVFIRIIKFLHNASM